MRVTLRCLQAANRLAVRSNTSAFIGLGRMGSEMAYNLFSKQFAQKPDSRFVVCDAVPEAASTFAENFTAAFPGAHVDIVASPEEATMASGTIVTMLPSTPHVQQVYNGVIIPTLRSLSPDFAKSTICIDSTTYDVTVSQQVIKDVIATGAQMVDAPVSGGVTGAKAGTLAFLVGGTEASFTAVNPILSMMGQRIVHCGPAGAGLGAKIVNNLILGVQQIVVAEGMILGQKLGLDPVILTNVIGSSTGSCWSLSVNNPVPSALPDKSPPCEREYEGGFATMLMEKDMGLASDLGSKTGTALPLGNTARRLYSDMIKRQPELARKDFSSVYSFLKGNVL